MNVISITVWSQLLSEKAAYTERSQLESCMHLHIFLLTPIKKKFFQEGILATHDNNYNKTKTK